MLDKGVISHYPPSLAGRSAYPHFVSRVDQDGNEVAGIRMPPVEAPVATTTGWALRRAGFGENEGCEASGSTYVQDHEGRAGRRGRPSSFSRGAVPDHEGYVAAVVKAAERLQQLRLLLPADVEQYIANARESSVLR